MLIDTHCHINMMVKDTFDTPLQESDFLQAATIVTQAYDQNVSIIINVGTREIENHNCILLAQKFDNVYATVGIHPNDSDEWQNDLKKMKQWLSNKKENKIVGIGECGIDRLINGGHCKAIFSHLFPVNTYDDLRKSRNLLHVQITRTFHSVHDLSNLLR